MTRRLRFVLFSSSIVSDFGNPTATTVRAMCRALIELGHDVVHSEERRNRHVVDLLTHRGAEPLRTFNRVFPLLTYRQFDILGGSARRVWFSREISTADVVVGFDGCEEGVAEEIRTLESNRTLSFFPEQEGLEAEWFEPAVLPRVGVSERTSRLAVGYDHPVANSGGYERYSAGMLLDPDWESVTGLDLPNLYGRAERVRVSVDDVSGPGFARALLPVASGAVTEIVDHFGTAVETIDRLDDAFNARLRAKAITEFVISELDARTA